VHLSELLRLRPVPAAGLLVTLTRRCPMACAHCSTSSTPAGEEPEAADLRAFVRSFAAADRPPDVLLLTGGEPLLLPDLVAELAAAARAAGTRTALLSGMFFARGGRVPDRILRAVTAADHFSASLDVHHEREVPRRDVFRAVRRILDAGVPVSFHLTGSGDDDPYLAEVTADIRRVFADRAPMLVNRVRPLGRAASWARSATVPDAAAAPAGAARGAPERPHGGDRPGTGPVPPGDRPDPGPAVPCVMAAWPVVAFDGTVVACCNQGAVDTRPAPGHLRLGHIAEDDWASVRRRTLDSPVLRAIRTVGPAHLRARYAPPGAATGYCDGCRALPRRPEVAAGAARDFAGPLGRLLDERSAARRLAAGPVALARSHGCPRYADLVTLPRTTGTTA
jgi:pyruvate-formate lyase-activating enzyme